MNRYLLLSFLIFTFFSTNCFAHDPLNSIVPSISKIEHRNGYANINSPVKVIVDKNRIDLGDEGYELICDPTEFIITAKTQAGAFYGKQTVFQLKSAGNFKACKIIDKPKMKIRGVMLDLARCKEKNEYYYHIIDKLAKWKINTVFIHFTDQEGCAIEIKKYPQIASPNAFTQEEMKDLINFAKERHIDLIPEVESWGHAGYILDHFPELKESDRDLCICNPKIYEVLGDIYSEIAELFPSKYLHIGCDEALSYGECDICKKFISEHGKDKLVEMHLNKLADMAKAVGKTPMMWTDILLKHPDIMDDITKDMIMCFWRYTEIVDPEPAKLLSSKGFKVIGCPAIVWYGRMILPRTDAIPSIRPAGCWR
ncbi:MAG: family 20 glycosylhydrolase [Armatimonadota bacterium]